MTGSSSGLNMYAAVELSRSAPPGSVIVVILPDSGIKYLSKFYNPEWCKAKVCSAADGVPSSRGIIPLTNLLASSALMHERMPDLLGKPPLCKMPVRNTRCKTTSVLHTCSTDVVLQQAVLTRHAVISL